MLHGIERRARRKEALPVAPLVRVLRGDFRLARRVGPRDTKALATLFSVDEPRAVKRPPEYVNSLQHLRNKKRLKNCEEVARAYRSQNPKTAQRSFQLPSAQREDEGVLGVPAQRVDLQLPEDRSPAAKADEGVRLDLEKAAVRT